MLHANIGPVKIWVNAVRFGVVDDVLAAGEGRETMASLRCARPNLPTAAALSANHLAALLLPVTLRRLYIARDADKAKKLGIPVWRFGGA